MIQHIILISLSVFAIHYTMEEGEIFGGLRKLLYRLPYKLHNPVFDCPVCMAPWYGAVIYWLFFPGPIEDFALTIICSLGLNAVIMKLAPDKETNYNEAFANLTEAVDDLTETYKRTNTEIIREEVSVYGTAETVKKVGQSIKRQNAKSGK